MKLLLTIFLVGYYTLAYSQKADMIIVEHIGMQNAPVDPFIISNTKADTIFIKEQLKFLKGRYYYTFYIFHDLLFILKESEYFKVDSIFSKVIPTNETKCQGAFGSFRILICYKTGLIDKRYVCRAAESEEYFGSINEQIVAANGKSELTNWIVQLIEQLKRDDTAPSAYEAQSHQGLPTSNL